MKLGSLFDGLGGFPRAAMLCGIEPVWASELEKFPIAVTRMRFPRMKHLGDITKINGAEIEPVDVITAGSPCQDLSVAGKRAGLSGERSNLFLEFVRIVREMRGATDGRYPAFAIWENVPGAFNSNDGHDFRTVLEEIAEAKVPMPKSGRWANAGMARGNGRSIAWRCLDAQHFGVPQRRRRIFLVADFGSSAAPEILFEQPCLSRNIAESGNAREEVAAGVGGCVTLSGETVARTITARHDSSPCVDRGQNAILVERPHVFSQQRSDEYIQNDVTSTQSARQYKDATDLAVCTPSQFGQYQEGVGTLRGSGGDCGGGSENLCVAQLYDMTHADEVIRPCPPGISPTLNSRMGTGGNQVPIMLDRSAAQVNAIDCRNLSEREELSGTLQSKASGGHSLNYQNPVRVGHMVRRLTPTECERLMGFPTGWTDIPGASDSARYKALGNSVAIPCVEYVLRGMARCL